MKSFENFYIFYDSRDFVKYCGTAKELVERGIYKNINAVHTYVAHIKQGVSPGTVAVLEGENGKYTLVRGRKSKYERKKTYP